MDETHETTSHDFNLITAFVIDEFKEGISVSWLICNRETFEAIKLFLSFLKKQEGDIYPSIIMTDKASQYYNSWTDVFGGKSLFTWTYVYY